MPVEINTCIQWSKLELMGLLEDENARVHYQRSKRHLGLYPFQLNDLKKALRDILNSEVNFYDKNLQGLVLAYAKPKLIGSLGGILHDSCFIHVDIEADFYVFKPEIGCVLKGIVNKKAENHVGVLVHKAFNVSIPKPDNNDLWYGDCVYIGQEVKFTVTHLDFEGKLPFIRGELIPDEATLENYREEKTNWEESENLVEIESNSFESPRKISKKSLLLDKSVVSGSNSEKRKNGRKDLGNTASSSDEAEFSRNNISGEEKLSTKMRERDGKKNETRVIEKNAFSRSIENGESSDESETRLRIDEKSKIIESPSKREKSSKKKRRQNENDESFANEESVNEVNSIIERDREIDEETLKPEKSEKKRRKRAADTSITENFEKLSEIDGSIGNAETSDDANSIAEKKPKIGASVLNEKKIEKKRRKRGNSESSSRDFDDTEPQDSEIDGSVGNAATCEDKWREEKKPKIVESPLKGEKSKRESQKKAENRKTEGRKNLSNSESEESEIDKKPEIMSEEKREKKKKKRKEEKLNEGKDREDKSSEHDDETKKSEEIELVTITDDFPDVKPFEFVKPDPDYLPSGKSRKKRRRNAENDVTTVGNEENDVTIGSNEFFQDVSVKEEPDPSDCESTRSKREKKKKKRRTTSERSENDENDRDGIENSEFFQDIRVKEEPDPSDCESTRSKREKRKKKRRSTSEQSENEENNRDRIDSEFFQDIRVKDEPDPSDCESSRGKKEKKKKRREKSEERDETFAEVKIKKEENATDVEDSAGAETTKKRKKKKNRDSDTFDDVKVKDEPNSSDVETRKFKSEVKTEIRQKFDE